MSKSIFTERQAHLSTQYLRELYTLSRNFRYTTKAWRRYAEDRRENDDNYWLWMLFIMANSHLRFRDILWLTRHEMRDLGADTLRLNLMDDIITAYQLSETILNYSLGISRQLQHSIVSFGAISRTCSSATHEAAADCKRLYDRLDSHSTLYWEGALHIMDSALVVAYGDEHNIPEELAELASGRGDRENILTKAIILRSQLEIYRQAPTDSFPYELNTLYREMMNGHGETPGYFQLFRELAGAEARYHEANHV